MSEPLRAAVAGLLAAAGRSGAAGPGRGDGTATGAPGAPRGGINVFNTFTGFDHWAALRGRLAAGQTVALNADPAGGYQFPAVVPQDALDWFRSKGYRVGFSFLDVWAEEHSLAFTAAKAMEDDLLADLRAAVDDALANGATFAEFARELTPILQRRGWWGIKEGVDPLTGEVRPVQLGSPRRLRTIYETNMRTARAAGQWQRIERTALTHPYLLYQLGPSHQHREQHVGWAGVLLPVDDPWWAVHFPPNGWGCLCWVRQVSRAEAGRLARDGIPVATAQVMDPATGLPTGHVRTTNVPVTTSAPPDRMVDWTNPRTGQTTAIPAGIDPGWGYNPGAHRAGPPVA